MKHNLSNLVVVIRPIMYVALSYDLRIMVDEDIKKALEL